VSVILEERGKGVHLEGTRGIEINVQWRSMNKKLMVFELLEAFGFMTDFTSQIEPWDGDNPRGLSKAFPPSE